MSDYRGGPLGNLTNIFLEVLKEASENNKNINVDKYINRWNDEIKYLNEILTTVK